jgi:hypothetical protein
MGEREREEKREGSMTCGPHQLVVGIEDKYRVRTGAGEMSLEKRILMTRPFRG